MKYNRITLTLVLLAVIALFGAGRFLTVPAGQAQTGEGVTGSQKWEYHTEVGNSSLADIQGRINRLGAEGWELSSVVYEPKTDRYIVFLKRRKS